MDTRRTSRLALSVPRSALLTLSMLIAASASTEVLMPAPTGETSCRAVAVKSELLARGEDDFVLTTLLTVINESAEATELALSTGGSGATVTRAGETIPVLDGVAALRLEAGEVAVLRVRRSVRSDLVSILPARDAGWIGTTRGPLLQPMRRLALGHPEGSAFARASWDVTIGLPQPLLASAVNCSPEVRLSGDRLRWQVAQARDRVVEVSWPAVENETFVPQTGEEASAFQQYWSSARGLDLPALQAVRSGLRAAFSESVDDPRAFSPEVRPGWVPLADTPDAGARAAAKVLEDFQAELEADPKASIPTVRPERPAPTVRTTPPAATTRPVQVAAATPPSETRRERRDRRETPAREPRVEPTPPPPPEQVAEARPEPRPQPPSREPVAAPRTTATAPARPAARPSGPRTPDTGLRLVPVHEPRPAAGDPEGDDARMVVVAPDLSWREETLLRTEASVPDTPSQARRWVDRAVRQGHGLSRAILAREAIPALHGKTWAPGYVAEFFADRSWYRPNPGFDWSALSKDQQEAARLLAARVRELAEERDLGVETWEAPISEPVAPVQVARGEDEVARRPAAPSRTTRGRSTGGPRVDVEALREPMVEEGAPSSTDETDEIAEPAPRVAALGDVPWLRNAPMTRVFLARERAGGFDPTRLRMAMAIIRARSGDPFATRPDLRALFEGQDWYVATDSYDERQLASVARESLTLLGNALGED
ncbi:MAG: hypothetical protein AAF533_07725 [Acidobacteriota bacterium]